MKDRLRSLVKGSSVPTTQLDPALRDFLARLDEARSHSTPSVFWQKQLEDRAAYDAGADEDLVALAERVKRGYGFEDLPKRVSKPAEDPAYEAAIDGLKRMRANAKQLDPTRMGIDKGTWEHLRALGFLQLQGLLDEYLEFIEPLGVRSTMSVARHWYYARQVDNWAREVHGEGPLDVLEVGAGAGNLGVLLARMGRVRSYTIIDLPDMLVHSAFTVWRQVPDVELRFESAPSADAWTFVSDGLAASTLTGEAFDLCLNFNSFMEMDRQARDGYFDIIYRTARPGALFVNVNRRQPALPLADGATWDNNPLLYPYRPDDRILAWEEDRFQTITRTKWEVPITLTVTRAGVIRPNG
jgi:predicted O-methyltransferase YrrM